MAYVMLPLAGENSIEPVWGGSFLFWGELTKVDEQAALIKTANATMLHCKREIKEIFPLPWS